MCLLYVAKSGNGYYSTISKCGSRWREVNCSFSGDGQTFFSTFVYPELYQSDPPLWYNSGFLSIIRKWRVFSFSYLPPIRLSKRTYENENINQSSQICFSFSFSYCHKVWPECSATSCLLDFCWHFRLSLEAQGPLYYDPSEVPIYLLIITHKLTDIACTGVIYSFM